MENNILSEEGEEEQKIVFVLKPDLAQDARTLWLVMLLRLEI
jgi:hypothetical protein